MNVYERLSRVLGSSVTIPRELGAVMTELANIVQDIEKRVIDLEQTQGQITSISNIKSKIERMDELELKMKGLFVEKPGIVKKTYIKLKFVLSKIKTRMLLSIQKMLEPKP